MPSPSPPGEAVGPGALLLHPLESVEDRAEPAGRPLRAYVHVPFCASRCGYCDFTTYTADEVGGTSRETYADLVLREVEHAAAVLDVAGARRPLSSVFVGGGTPTLLPPGHLPRVLDALRDSFGLVDDAEVTVEANPESVDRAGLERLVAAGVDRVSFGWQSSASHVLQVLDRRHTPGRAAAAVTEARAAGVRSVSADLIYGAHGETAEDWRRSLDAVLAAGVDHVSAYALVVEEGTALARQVARGVVPAPDDDVLADRYEVADDVLAAAGLSWYEISSWARSPEHRCAHNVGYWAGDDWWGLGTGAHSHVGGVRWWNVRHPGAYGARVAAVDPLDRSPAQAREVLDDVAVHDERLMLGLRVAAGLPRDDVPPAATAVVDAALADGLLDEAAARAGRLVLTRRGRLLADALVLDLVTA